MLAFLATATAAAYAAAAANYAQAYAAVEAAARRRNTFLKLLNLLLQNS